MDDMKREEQIKFAEEEVKRISNWLAEQEYHWSVFTRHMEMGEIKEYKELCQRRENTMYILEDWLRIVKESNNEP